MTSTAIAQPIPRKTWGKHMLKTVGILILTVPFLTVNGFLLEMTEFKASLGAGQSMVIDWDEVPGILLNTGMMNALGLPVVFALAAAISFGMAHALGGKGAFGLHCFKISAAYLKIVLAVTGVALLTLITRYAGLLNLVVAAWTAKTMSEAIAEAHSFSNRRGCLTSISLALPVFAIAILVLLGPLFAK